MRAATRRDRTGRRIALTLLALVMLCGGAAMLLPEQTREPCPPQLLFALTDHFGFDEARRIAADVTRRVKEGTLRRPANKQEPAAQFVAYAQMPRRLVQTFLLVNRGSPALRKEPQSNGKGTCISATLPEFAVEFVRLFLNNEVHYSMATVDLVRIALADSPPEKQSPKRIVVDAAAFLIERSGVVSSDQIVEHVMNLQYFGAGVYGIGNAARFYLGKTLDELTLAETAYLVGLPKAPNNYHPIRYRQNALDRRHDVLDRMVSAGVISAAEAEAAAKEPLITVLR
jgi:hypothetical protein